jgi:hypothetical protein
MGLGFSLVTFTEREKTETQRWAQRNTQRGLETYDGEKRVSEQQMQRTKLFGSSLYNLKLTHKYKYIISK